jgi:uncharacterized protein (UPF0335 family)
MSSHRVVASELAGFVSEMESHNARKAEIGDLQKEVMARAKARGYLPKVIRRIIAERRRDQGEVNEEEAILQLYRDALGMGGTPMGDYIEQQSGKKAAVEPVAGIREESAGAFGEPVPLTQEEWSAGIATQFKGRTGIAATIGAGRPRGAVPAKGRRGNTPKSATAQPSTESV